ncbi:MAG: inositol monophosphatase family protein [Desulfitobacterium hafniense]|nr:inositol monophosphatase family protein [Desulfitobacterium hafniense]
MSSRRWVPELEILAREAGEIVLKGFKGAKKISQKSSAMDIVTEYDTEVEAFLRKTIEMRFPGHRVLGEEEEYLSHEAMGSILPERGFVWVVDPIDGTLNFAYGIPLLAISIALYLDSELIAGVVYNPVIDEMFSAEQGQGATCNGVPIKVSAVNELEKALVAISVGRRKQDSKLFKLADLVGGMRALGSAATALAYVAAGRIDGYWERDLNLWDIAAGLLLVKEAGGKVALWPEGQHIQIRDLEILGTNSQLFSEISSERVKL